jgi:hydroxymethylpyrimidine/phosphomethylpyrimidine kinase
MSKRARALSVAGSDCSGGAGIQADLKTFQRFGVFGQSALTAVVAENTVGVQGIHAVPEDFVALQIASCLSDIGADAVKTGMLVSGPVIRAAAAKFREHKVSNLVVDPVMRAKSGDALIAPEAVAALVEEIFPLAAIVTPNVPEAEALTGLALDSEDNFREAAERIRRMGARIVVMKGGHSPVNPEGVAADFVWDGESWTVLSGTRSSNRNTHGTGCTFSAAAAALLAQGVEPLQALARAKAFITRAIATADDLGQGHGPVNHWADISGEAGLSH